MDITARHITEAEFDAFKVTLNRTFGGDAVLDDEDRNRRMREVFDVKRLIAAFDGSATVGTAGAFTLDLTVPGGHLAMGGTTVVAVSPTHRRRGALNAMMRVHLDEVRERGEPLAGLWASETSIYGRYGFGSASEHRDLSFDGRSIRFIGEAPAGGPRFVDVDEAAQLVPPLYERIRAARPGALSRSDAWWRNRKFHDPEEWRDGSSGRRWVVYERDGNVDGYVAFRQKEQWDDGIPNGKVDVIELMPATADAHAGLWRFLASVDLFPQVHYWNLPADDPLPWIVDNRRRILRKVGDDLWVRIMDVPVALAGRRYLVDDRLVVAVRDPFISDNAGTYELITGPDGAECRRTEARAELELDIADLGAVYLGAHAPSTLARAGRIEGAWEHVLRADRIFAWSQAPWCPEVF